MLRIERSYNARGLLDKVTSYNSSPTVVNQVENEYNDFNQLASQWQNPAGEVVKTGGEPSPRVQFAYADGGDNHVRRTSMTYPDGRVLEYDYGSGGSAADKLSRIAALNIDDGAGADPVAQYTYLGAGSVVTAHHPEPDYTWNLATGSGATRYAGLDTFDRTLTCLWLGDVSGTPDDVVHLAYQYDRASNRISRQDLVSKNLGTAVYRDEAYTYDGLDRLVDVQRGELSGGSITGLNFQQNWQDPSTADTALDPTGNWTDFRQDTTGNTTFDMVQTRSHNKENEITDIDATSGGSWVDPLYDAVGNTTTIPRVAAPSQNYLLTFDAWNRVVAIKTGSGELTSIGDYSYDGLHRRVSRTMYTSGSPFFTRRMYYSDQWQVLEERQEYDSEWLLNKQYVWGIRYIDELVLRDQDTSNPLNGTLNTRHYALQDANFNVVALINTNGSVVRRFEYDAYGHSITLEADYTPGAYEYDFEYRYAGYRWDYETYLLQVRNRWYHPRLGRWVSRDPVSYVDGMSLYGYATSRPTTGSDPMGLTYEEDGENLQYTCNCGWIDWNHATPGALRGIFEMVDEETDVPLGKNQSYGLPEYLFDDDGFKIRVGMYGTDSPSIGTTRSYMISYGLSPEEKKSVALAIWMEISRHFEEIQGNPLIRAGQWMRSWFTGDNGSSSFSEEDLPSNIIAFYMKLNDWTREDILKPNICGPEASRACKRKIIEKTGGPKMNPNRTFQPRDYNMHCCECSSPLKWPAALSTVKPAKKGWWLIYTGHRI